MPEPRIIDLRSDTVTQPTPAMREAMARAEVGDDVFGEDPTVRRLEASVASEAHVLHYEGGGAAGLGGIELRTVPNDARGMLDLDALEATIRGQNIHFPRTALVCLENTHNRCGGGVLTAEETG